LLDLIDTNNCLFYAKNQTIIRQQYNKWDIRKLRMGEMEHEVNQVCSLRMKNLEDKVEKIDSTIKEYPVMEVLLKQQIISNEKQSLAMEQQAKAMSDISMTLVKINDNQDRMNIKIEKIEAQNEQVKTRKLDNWEKIKISVLTALSIAFVIFMLSKIPEFLVSLG